MLADVPVAQWQSCLRFHLLDDASPYLSDAFVSERFDFYSKTLQRPEGTAAALEARAGRASRIRPARPWASGTCEVAFPPESKAHACSSWWTTCAMP